jgi:Fe2+ transport system protein FeoA
MAYNPADTANASDAERRAVTTQEVVPLTALRRGERAVLCRADLPLCHTELLSAMGLAERCEVCVCRGGEPCIVRVHATRLGLSAELARRILVTRRAPSAS